ncbi:MAG: hypothetical protein ACE5DK_00865 [Paracoccaceae bacterium]
MAYSGRRVGTLRCTVLLVAAVLALSACNLRLLKKKPPFERPVADACDPAAGPCIEVQTPDQDTMRPRPRPGTPAQPAPAGEGFVEGVSAETLDKTSDKDKEKALKTEEKVRETELGRTIASLGAVGQQGFWLKTPLVLKETQGRIVWADNGNSVNVTLMPKGGEATSGSQISLAAMRALEIPLTALPELIVFAR